MWAAGEGVKLVCSISRAHWAGFRFVFLILVQTGHCKNIKKKRRIEVFLYRGLVLTNPTLTRN